MRHRVTFALLCAVLVLPAAGETRLDDVPEPGYVSRAASPDGQRCLFYRFVPGEAARLGVARADGTVVWWRSAGLRPITDHAWSADGRHVLFVTDCDQEDAELRSRNPDTRSWLIVLDAAGGAVVGEGDLDTRVLDLARRCPGALGAAHEIEKLWMSGDTVGATIACDERRVSGQCALGALEVKR